MYIDSNGQFLDIKAHRYCGRSLTACWHKRWSSMSEAFYCLTLFFWPIMILQISRSQPTFHIWRRDVWYKSISVNNASAVCFRTDHGSLWFCYERVGSSGASPTLSFVAVTLAIFRCSSNQCIKVGTVLKRRWHLDLKKFRDVAERSRRTNANFW